MQALGFFAVDGHDKLRISSGVGAEQADQILLFAGATFANEVVCGFVQFLEGMVALVLHFELESTERAEALDGGRFNSNHKGSRYSEHAAANAVEDGRGTLVLSLTLGIRLKRHKNQTAIGRASAKTEARDRERTANFRDGFGDSCNLLANLAGVLERRARGSLHNHDQIALVFIRNETFRDALKYEVREPEAGGEEDEGHRFVAQESAQRMDVSVRDRFDDAVDATEKPVLPAVLAAQQQRGQSGSQCQSVEG